MRACFLGQNICTLGYGVATLQGPLLVMDQPARLPSGAEKAVSPRPGMDIPEAPIEPRSVANPPRMDV